MVSLVRASRQATSALLVLALLAVPQVFAQQKALFEESARPDWKEAEIAFPAYPAASDLIPLDVGASATTKFFIDEKSLSLADDGVVRYTLVARGSGGAENVSFEGIRCETAERKLYAIGRGNGEWVRSRNDAWQQIAENSLNRQHAQLAKEFFCPPSASRPTLREIIQSLRKDAGLR